jgi:haloalkane dehalogenase
MAQPLRNTRPTLLMLHGIPDSRRVWEGVVRTLGADVRCHAPDLPGFGSATESFDPHSADALVEAVDDVTDPLSEKVVLVVHDAGALFGVAWATARPERIAALVFLNSSVFADRRWHWGARILRMPAAGELAMALMPARAFRREMQRAACGGRSEADIADTFRVFGPTARRTALNLYRFQSRRVLSNLSAPALDLVARRPSLVVWGEADPYLPAQFASRWGAATVRRHPALGHWPHAEAPDQVAADIRAFLEKAGLLAI